MIKSIVLVWMIPVIINAAIAFESFEIAASLARLIVPSLRMLATVAVGVRCMFVCYDYARLCITLVQIPPQFTLDPIGTFFLFPILSPLP